jgi:hypothetical protein
VSISNSSHIRREWNDIIERHLEVILRAHSSYDDICHGLRHIYWELGSLSPQEVMRLREKVFTDLIELAKSVRREDVTVAVGTILRLACNKDRIHAKQIMNAWHKGIVEMAYSAPRQCAHPSQSVCPSKPKQEIKKPLLCLAAKDGHSLI